MNITVCIATYLRPDLLIVLLDSLENQSWLSFGELTIIVIDNDPAGSARQLVEGRAMRSRCSLLYYQEPKKGISAARNMALKLVSTPFFAFIDDDEFADKAWIKTLYDTAISYDADVVFGPVKPLFPQNVPSWLERLNMYRSPDLPSGTEVRIGATNNVLIKTAAVQGLGMTFSDFFGTTGGSDTDFFFRLRRHGLRMVWCNDAWVSEIIDVQRVALKWMVLRGFRTGQTFARVCLREESAVVRVAGAISRIAAALPLLLAIPLISIFSRRIGVNLLQKTAGWAGQVYVILGFSKYYQEYK